MFTIFLRMLVRKGVEDIVNMEDPTSSYIFKNIRYLNMLLLYETFREPRHQPPTNKLYIAHLNYFKAELFFHSGLISEV